MELRAQNPDVKPIGDRKNFIFMAASHRVSKMRKKLGCAGNYNKTVAEKSQLIMPENIAKMPMKEQHAYLSRLGDSQFCIAPKGLAGTLTPPHHLLSQHT